jgi:ABC-type lipoprotein release transport system permease subunit
MNKLTIIVMLGWRNLWRNHRRTIVMVSAITIAVWAMIFMTALMRGMVNDMIRDGIRALPGHVQVHHPEFRNDPSIDNLIPTPDSSLVEAFSRANLEGWASRVRVPAVISSERETRGVTLVGVDPVLERTLDAVGGNIAEGRYLGDVNDGGVVIGRKLADKLDTELGKRVVIMSQDPDNDIADRGYRVVGLFEASLEQHEETFVFAGKTTVQKVLGIEDRVTEVAVMAADYRELEEVSELVTTLAGQGVEVLPWPELDTYLGMMLKVMDGFVLVWLIVVFLALSFGLVNTLVMAVFERVREIGLMLALGMRPSNILGQVMIESALLLVIGLLLGNVLAYASVVPLKDGIDVSAVAEGMEMFGYASILYPAQELKDTIMANVVVLVLGFFAEAITKV